jgi:threonylcarbamoyladenosine tRNA methylthiotransferase MtaB
VKEWSVVISRIGKQRMGPEKKFYIQTFGCRCNQADSAAIRASLRERSLREAENASDANLVVVNSCTVTHRTDQQIRQAVRRTFRENPQARVVVTGCYAERDPLTLAAIPGVSLVVGNAGKDRLAEIVEETSNDPAVRIVRAPFDAERDYLMPPASQAGGRTRPFVKLQDGCDARCSYCIIPAVRGPGRSARPEEILKEIQTLIGRGYQEIVLTGVHLGTYGRKMERSVSLLSLLRQILELPGLGRLRLSSIEPMRFSREIVELAEGNPVFAPHFHIPLQSGSDAILRRMRRPYSAGRFMDLLELIRTKLPHAGLGTDILVGFPGETDTDFEATCRVLRDSPLTYAHIFPFSAREGTAAYSMPHQVDPKTTRERARIARDISQEKNAAFRGSFLKTVLRGITLAKEEQMGESVVLTENYIQAFTPAMESPPNRLVHVRIDEVQSASTRGTIIE